MTIVIYYNDHIPPHFHIIYNEINTLIEIDNGKYMKGNVPLPKSKEKDVLRWLDIYRKVWEIAWKSGNRSKFPLFIRRCFMMVLIKKAKVVPGLKGWLLIDFDNNRKFVNINPHMEGVLEKLKDQSFFAEAFVDKELQTVSWPGELDLDPDNLYYHGIDMELVSNLVVAVKKNNELSDFINKELVAY